MRVVFDTNVIVAAFLWQRGLKPIYAVIRTREVIPCFSQVTWDELRRVLAYKKFAAQILKIGITGEEILRLLSSRAHFTIARSSVFVITDDPSDNAILASAAAARASVIVSGDQHLKAVGSFRGIPVLTPHEFIIRHL